MTQSLAVNTARSICWDLLPKVSRSFALAIDALPNPSRDYICVAYLLCRMVDTIEDHPTLLGKDKYYDLFDSCIKNIKNWESLDVSLLEKISPPQSWDDELMQNSAAVLTFFESFPAPIIEILQRNVLEMSFGMRSYTARSEHTSIVLNNDADLDRYCYYVAGTVGNLLTEVFAHEANITDEHWFIRQKERGYHFALGLQKVNMIKDVVQDLKRGSIFVPTEWLTKLGVSPEDLSQGENNPKVRLLLHHFIKQALNHLILARDYIIELPVAPAGFRLFCVWPYAMALDTLKLGLEKDHLFTQDHEIKISRAQVTKMMQITKRVVPFNMPLKFYFNQKIAALKSATI